MWIKYFLLAIALICSSSCYAESKVIEVYSEGAAFWDVQPGDTLSEIVSRLLPDQPSKRADLMTEIMQTNPSAFSNNHVDFLKANVRLWLPTHGKGRNQPVNKDKYTIREFNWGYIQSHK